MKSGRGIKLLVKMISLVFLCAGLMQYVVYAEASNTNLASEPTLTVSENAGVKIENYRLEIGGKEITDSSELPVVSDGDTIIMAFDWSLPDDDRTTTSFLLDLNVDKKNIQIIDKNGFLRKDAVDVGTYEVKNGILEVEFYTDTAFFQGIDRRGGLRVEGALDVDESVLPTDKFIDITMGSVSAHLPYLNKATVDLRKTAGEVEVSGDKLIQTFKIVLTAIDGNVKINSFADILGSGFSNMSDIKVVGNTATRVSGLVVGTSYSINDINSILSTSIMDKDTEIELEYTVEVDNGIYDPDTMIEYEELEFVNKAQVIYNDKMDEPVEATTTTTVNKPTMTKTGKFSSDYTSITWTISIALNDFSGIEFEDLFVKGADEPGAGLVADSLNEYGAIDLEADDFTYNSTTNTYDYIYNTPITKEYQQSASRKELVNNVAVLLEHSVLGSHYYSAIAKQTMPGRNWVEKTVESYDLENKLITWKIQLTNIPEGITGMQVRDLIIINDSLYAYHEFGNTTITLVDEEGTATVLRENNENKASDIATISQTDNNVFLINFADAYTSTKYGEDLTLYITTVSIDEESRRPYRNNVNIYYYDDGIQYNLFDSAEFKDISRSLDKEGTVEGETSIKYQFYVDMTMLDVKVGVPIYIEDSLPEGLVLDTSTGENGITLSYINRLFVNGVSAGQTTTWFGHQELVDLTEINYDEDSNKIIITFTPDDVFYNTWTREKNPGGTPDRRALMFEYVADVEDVSEFIRNSETVEYKNQVTGEYEGKSLGEASCGVELTPFDVASKQVDDVTYINKDIVKYTIDVNEKKLNLSGDTLVAQDILGRGLAYILEDSNYPIVVEEYTDTGDWVPLQYRTDYTYYFATEDNSLVFTIPDEKHLRISYYVRINIRKDEYYTEEVATNTFKLQGINNFTDDSSVILSRANLFSFAWVDYNVGSIELYKYWFNGDMVPLPNVEFALYETNYENGELSLGNVIRDDIAVNEQGRVTIENIKVDVIYALIETKTPLGYESNNKPYYFILPGDDMPTLPSGYPIQYLVDGSVLYFENHKVETGFLELSKNVAGIIDWDTVKDNIRFEVYDNNGIVKTIHGSDLDATMSYTFGLASGAYTVKEIVTTIDGYNCVTEYQVDASGFSQGAEADFVVRAETTTNVTFKNEYKPKTNTEEDLPDQPAQPDQSETKPSSSATQNNAGENSQIIVTNQLDNTNEKADSGMYTSPQTGRASMLWVVVVFIASGIGLAVVIKQIYRSRKRVEP